MTLVLRELDPIHKTFLKFFFLKQKEVNIISVVISINLPWDQSLECVDINLKLSVKNPIQLQISFKGTFKLLVIMRQRRQRCPNTYRISTTVLPQSNL